MNVPPFKYDPVETLWSDPTNNPIVIPLMKNLGTSALAADAAVGDTQVTLSTGHSSSIGEELVIAENSVGVAYYGTILNVAGDIITLDTPLDYAFTALGAFVLRGQTNIATSSTGSLSSPDTFLVRPPNFVKWDITRLIFYMVDGAAFDDSKFGSAAALTNGIVIRLNKPISSERIFNVGNAKTNGELANLMYDFTYTDKAGAGNYGGRGRMTVSGPDKMGVAIRLDGGDDPLISADAIELLVQDDLTDLISMKVIAQGHVVIE